MPTAPNKLPLWVTGLGMVSSLGFDVATGCAAARAGLSRARPMEGYAVVSEDGDDVGVIGHALPFATDGFEGDVRLQRLVELALIDLYRGCPWLGSHIAGAYLALPEAPRGATDAASAKVALGARLEGSHELQLMWSAAVIGIAPHRLPLRFASRSGATGFARAVAAAAADLQSGQVDAAVVGAADSLLDIDTLAGLEGAYRLKSPDAPAGLQPGEGAAFVVLQPARSMAANALASLCGFGVGHEEHGRDSDQVPTGAGITQAVHAALTSAAALADPYWCISSHNGEHYSAMECGSADVLLAASGAGSAAPPWYAAASFGDTGAAHPALGVCMATVAFRRGYAPAATALIVAGSERASERVALALRAG